MPAPDAALSAGISGSVRFFGGMPVPGVFKGSAVRRFPAARLQTASLVRPLDKACAWGDNGVLLF
ncbi:TPA: hypothetical protein ACJJQE_000329 [Neisseria meningitidis]